LPLASSGSWKEIKTVKTDVTQPVEPVEQLDNVVVAREMTSLETYDLIIRNYKDRSLSEQHLPWFETIVRQRDLKRKEMRAVKIQKKKARIS
jgi:hypothetical protein